MPNAAFFPERSPRIKELEECIDNWNNGLLHFAVEHTEDGSPVTDNITSFARRPPLAWMAPGKGQLDTGTMTRGAYV
jgi:hypothetical protein